MSSRGLLPPACALCVSVGQGVQALALTAQLAGSHQRGFLSVFTHSPVQQAKTSQQIIQAFLTGELRKINNCSMSFNFSLHIKPVCQLPVTADGNRDLVLVGKRIRIN